MTTAERDGCGFGCHLRPDDCPVPCSLLPASCSLDLTLPHAANLWLAGGHMFSGSYDKSVRVWDVHSLQCLSTLQGHSGAVRALAASSKRVFSGSDDTTIKVGSA